MTLGKVSVRSRSFPFWDQVPSRYIRRYSYSVQFCRLHRVCEGGSPRLWNLQNSHAVQYLRVGIL